MLKVEVVTAQSNEKLYIVDCWNCGRKYFMVTTTKKCRHCGAVAINVARIVHNVDDRLDWHILKKDFLIGYNEEV